MPALYRIHEPPDPLKVLQFEEFVSAFGFSLGAPEGGGQAEALPEAGREDPRHSGRAADRVPDAADDAEGALRRDERRALRPRGARPTRTSRRRSGAIRTWSCTGCCASCATRKVSDERKAELDEDLPEVGRHTSEMERRAAEAEREILQWKKVRFMADKVGDVFDGYITGVAPFGMFVELIEHYVEGLVHVSTMADDYYRFREQSHALFGENTKKTYRLGDRVRVQIIRVDMERRQIDLGLEDVLEKVRRDERSRGPAAQLGAAEEGAAQGHAASSAASASSGLAEERRRQARRSQAGR